MTVTTAVSNPVFKTIAASNPESHTKLRISSEEFDRLCVENPDLRLEMKANGELIVMAPTGGESGKRNFNLLGQLWAWSEQNDLGEAFDSSTGYDFTDFGGGKLSPDGSWIEKSRLAGVSIIGFIPVVPDFVIELRSVSDNLSTLQEKMQEYQRLGVKLGLLINPKDKQVEIYRINQTVEVMNHPIAIDCSPILPNFVLSMNRMW